MKVLQTNTFKHAIKKLHRTQLAIIKDVIEKIRQDPFIGELKKGDLAGVYIHKFHINHQLILIAYLYEEKSKEHTLTLLSVASHENFYANLKRQIKS